MTAQGQGGLRHERWLLALVLLLALVVRLWGIDFGLPNEHARPDERHLIGFTLTMGGNKLNPGFFNYPSFYLYLLLGCYLAYFVVGRLTGRFHSSRDLIAEYAISPDAFYLIDRVLVASLSTATVAVVYWLVRQLLGARAALLAALFLALSYLHVRDSHYGTVDVPLTFVATLALALMVRARLAPSLKAGVLAGLCTGLAVSTKYNGVALLAPLLWCGMLQLEGAPRGERLSRAVRWLLPALLAVPVGFVLGTPYSMLDWATFSRDVAYELIDKGSARPALDLGPGWLYHARYTLPHGLGVPLLLAALVGVALWLRDDLRTAVLLLGFPLAWYVGVGKSHYVFVRYVVPLAPALCIFAAYALEQLMRSTLERWGPGPRGWGPIAVGCVVLLVPPVSNVVQWNILASRTDSRVLAAEWLKANVPAGESVGMIGPVYIRPDLWATPEQMQRASAASNAQGRGLRNELRIEHLSKTGAPSYELRAFQQGAWVDTLNLGATGLEPPAYVVLTQHPAWVPEAGSVPQLSSDYREVARFEAFGPAAKGAFFDRHDAVYSPYARFDDVSAPGPNIRIMSRKAAR